MALRARKVAGAFEKRAPGLVVAKYSMRCDKKKMNDRVVEGK